MLKTLLLLYVCMVIMLDNGYFLPFVFAHYESSISQTVRILQINLNKNLLEYSLAF